MTVPNQLCPKQIANFRTQKHDHRILQKRLSKDLAQQLQTQNLKKQESIRKIWLDAEARTQPSF